MTEYLDIFNIIFLAIAILILFRLRSVLGRRTGNERPPFNPYASSKPKEEVKNDKTSQNAEQSQEAVEEENTVQTYIDTIAKPGTELNDSLLKIVEKDQSFNPEQFLEGAKSAYEMIVTAFNDDNRKGLQNLLSEEVYGGFVNVITERENAKEKIEFTFIGIKSAKIVDASLKDEISSVTVRFFSQIISTKKDSDGNIVDGDPNLVQDVTDIWTFSRDITSSNPNWLLVATEAEG